MTKSVSLLADKVNDLCESSEQLKEAFKGFSDNLDAFIEVYIKDQERTNERLDRLEKHLGL